MIIKKKGKIFAEKKAFKKRMSVKDPEDIEREEISKYLYEKYMNQNRIDSVFSKLGYPEKKIEIGKYLKEIQIDIRNDIIRFEADENGNTLERRIIKMATKKAAEDMKIAFFKELKGE